MKTSWMVAVVVCGLVAAPLLAQDKVAEGEYQIHAVSKGVPLVKTATRWVLTSNKSGGYHLTSEIQNQPTGMRVVQVEELDSRLAPTAIGYELYQNGDMQPGITVNCMFSEGAVTCGGVFEKKQVESSSPYKQDGSFWLWMEGLFALDMPWLLDGTVNLAHLEKGSSKVPTVNVLGGTAVLIGDAVSVAKLKAVQQIGQKLTVIAPDKPTKWELYSDEESLLEFLGQETVEFEGAKVAARHYTFTNGRKPMHLWIAGSGVLIRIDDFVLANYKQKKPLIPELPVETK